MSSRMTWLSDMKSLPLALGLLQAGLFAVTAVTTGSAMAQAVLPVRSTVDVTAAHGNLSSGLPQAESLNLRGVFLLDNGDVAYAELLDERKFGRHGGIAAGAYTHVFSPDWYATGTAAIGRGGPNWASTRLDAQVSRKWLAQRQLVTSAALYGARYENDRTDSGLRLSAAWYLPLPAVLEGGITFNVSQPGRVHSHMPYIAATYGREGWQYLTVRASSGTEAYQALGGNQQLVDFRSNSQSLGWRRWIGERWGFTAQAERYRNPTYQRHTVGLGLFVQW